MDDEIREFSSTEIVKLVLSDEEIPDSGEDNRVFGKIFEEEYQRFCFLKLRKGFPWIKKHFAPKVAGRLREEDFYSNNR
ncbi:MAG: hypothetical protein BTN85_1164 [Candidatus Methanohalarchaeum thermophilum]|uniref:Uncharacterized protein n=1 Tax=Methanohalarchaeum thermophilum TaxID=1903181 RepID=A0A1Q6DWE4_METT1|nr:MAG: hypothetical protein BTN85_1164 [Candidatus Methanohalarchaeum thermophilum]